MDDASGERKNTMNVEHQFFSLFYCLYSRQTRDITDEKSVIKSDNDEFLLFCDYDSPCKKKGMIGETVFFLELPLLVCVLIPSYEEDLASISIVLFHRFEHLCSLFVCHDLLSYAIQHRSVVYSVVLYKMKKNRMDR